MSSSKDNLPHGVGVSYRRVTTTATNAADNNNNGVVPQLESSEFESPTSSSFSGDDWEEWDGRSPFWVHCVAGSMAGLAEHSAVYPLDTVRTHIQVCASCLQQHGAGGSGGSSSGAMHGTMPSAADAVATAGLHQHHHHHRSSTAAAGGVVTSSRQPRKQLPTGMWQTIRFLVSEPAIATTTTTTTTASGGGGAVTALHAPPSARAAAAAAASNAVSSATTSPSLSKVFTGCARLWRGVQTVLIGCIPAHALYFSSYETVKAFFSTVTGEREMTFAASAAAGAAAVCCHDAVMSPLDTVKQRMQLGHYRGVADAVGSIASSTEGYAALFRSLPVTLATNVPYGMVMVSVNEWAKLALSTYDNDGHRPYQHQQHHQQATTANPTWQTIVIASSLAGFTASAVTTPLDRIKTALQTQALRPVCALTESMEPPSDCPQRPLSSANKAAAAATTTARASSSGSGVVVVHHEDWKQAFRSILRKEGWSGFFRGMLPRVLSHTPAAAISWTTYEACKRYLLQQQSA